MAGGRSFPLSDREGRRLRLVRERLARISHLQIGLGMKGHAVSTAALSLLDFLTPPSARHLVPLRKLVRMALNAAFGAPEIVFLGVVGAILDPYLRGYVALVRLWIAAARQDNAKVVLSSRKLKNSGGRLASALKMSESLGWKLDHASIWIPNEMELRSYDFSLGWDYLRKKIAEGIRHTSFARLQERRPNRYGGITRVAWGRMHRPIAQLENYESTKLLRIWAGVPMVGQHKQTLHPDQVFPCPCGEPIQSLSHLMWNCPLLEGRPDHLAYWSLLSKAETTALIPEEGRDAGYHRDWETICRWGAKVLSLPEKMKDSEKHLEPANRDLFPYTYRGHLIERTVSGAYAYCTKCFVARKLRDHHFIGVRRCVAEDCLPCPEDTIQPRTLT